tara:strand:+ start:4240 stop:4707 length:468 start_codon:yes stop_codon:yes gene_type:complete
MWLISSDNESNDFNEFKAIMKWFHTHQDQLLLQTKNSYYPRLSNTDKRGIASVKEICKLICLDEGIAVSIGTVVKYIPLTKLHYTLNTEGVIVYNNEVANRIFKDHQDIKVSVYNPVVIDEVEVSFIDEVVSLLDAENVTSDDIKKMIKALVDKL